MNELIKKEMNIDNAIERSNTRELTPAVWQMIERISQAAYKSRMYKGITTPETAAMIMLKGYELGLGISASFEFITPIQGKYELIPRGALALLQGNPTVKLKINRLVDDNDTFVGYETTIERSNGFTYTNRFTIQDAVRAGLVKPDSGWEKYPENMCLWRSVGFTADVAAGDITSGMTSLLKMPEQYGIDLDVQGNVIEGTASEVTQPAMAPVAALPVDDSGVTLEDLAMQYGGEAILIANNGRIPATQDELERVATNLRGA